MSVLTHWQLLPPLMMRYGEQDALSYVLYLTGGCVVACHLEQADAWVRRHARLVVTLTAVAALAAEAVYLLAQDGVTTVLGSGDDPFQPSVIPFNIGAIACGYLAGVALVRPGRSRLTRAAVRSGSDNAYGIDLSHMLVITTLMWLGWGQQRDEHLRVGAAPAGDRIPAGPGLVAGDRPGRELARCCFPW